MGRLIHMALKLLIMNSQPGRTHSAPVILKAGLLAGTLDILSAFTYYYIKTGKNPLNVLTYVSNTALGKETFSSTAVQQLTGLLVHFAIAFGWTVLFFLLYPRLKFLQANRIITAVLYGSFVWSMMNLVILPVWNHKMFQYKGETTIVNWLILIVAIGMPLSFIASSHWQKRG